MPAGKANHTQIFVKMLGVNFCAIIYNVSILRGIL